MGRSVETVTGSGEGIVDQSLSMAHSLRSMKVVRSDISTMLIESVIFSRLAKRVLVKSAIRVKCIDVFNQGISDRRKYKKVQKGSIRNFRSVTTINIYSYRRV